MESLEITDAGAARPPQPPWSAAQKLLFRLVFCYLTLYLPTLYLNVVPIPDVLTAPWNGFWTWVVPKVGKATLGVDATWQLSGSGDTSFDWVQLGCFVVLALVATFVWTLLDRRRLDYRRLFAWLRAATRLGVAATMIYYGAIKLIPSQFPPPSLERLAQPFGDASPMGLLWSFMGSSAPYTSFTGGAELLSGLLLACRRTTLLGALMTMGVMAHVAALNLCYDVPVKLMSLHMVLLAAFVVMPDWRRLTGFFVPNRAVHSGPLPALVAHPKWHRGLLALRMLAVLALTTTALVHAHEGRTTYGAGSPRSPLRGIWEVVELEADGVPRPPLTTDGSRLRRVVFDYPEMLSIRRMNDEHAWMWLKLDPEKQTMELTQRRNPEWGTAQLSYERPEPDVLLLTGTFEKQQIKARLVRRPEQKFLLLERGFHWVSEFPFNR